MYKLNNCKLWYIDLNYKESENGFKIYGTNKSKPLLKPDEILQYFTDWINKCLPNEMKENVG